MTDVSVVRHDERYVAGHQVETDRLSALRLISSLLTVEGLTLKHRREQLSLALWKWTEAEGIAPYAKYNTRFVSAGVVKAGGPTPVNHEPVWPREPLVTTLLSRTWTDAELRDFLEQYGVACILTTTEHAVLCQAKASGWDRYAVAGVEVLDRFTGEWLDLSSAIPSAAVDAAPPAPAADVTDQRHPDEDEDDRLTADNPVDAPTLVAAKSAPEIQPLMHRLLRSTRFMQAMAVPSVKVTGEPSNYFRVYDTAIEEPTPAVAYVHWSGKVDFRLRADDLPPYLAADPRVARLAHATYGISCKVEDEATLELVEDLLFAALDKLGAA